VINTGHSRVPVYREDIQQVVGLLLTRRLVGMHTRHRLASQCQNHFLLLLLFLLLMAGVDGNAEKRVCQLPLADTPLYDILNQFKSGKSTIPSSLLPAGWGSAAALTMSLPLVHASPW
jgi:CBS domain containing-hemolysin-like protein